jgi:hypothetical protein
MPFQITRIWKEQNLTQSFPWHSDGGEWTWLDCSTVDREPVDFGVGMELVTSKGGSFGFGKVTIAVADAKAGAMFVQEFAAAFEASVPQPRAPQPLPGVG